MRRIFGLVFVLLLALVCFYGVWPAISLQKIKAALKDGDQATLAGKIDFPAVRQSLRPFAAAEMDKAVAQLEKAGGIGGVIGGQLKDQVRTKLVDGVLEAMVTPERLVKMYAEGQDLKELMAKFRNAAGTGGAAGDGKAGGLDAGKLLGELFGGKKAEAPAQPAAPTPATSTPPSSSQAPAQAKSSYSLANVKGFGPRGPLGFWVGIARDPKAAEADAIADMRFTGGDWKLVGLVPRI